MGFNRMRWLVFSTVLGFCGASTEVDGCNIRTGQDCVGGDIRSSPAADASTCCALCASAAGCAAFTFNEYDATGKREGTCYQKSGCASTTACGTCMAGTAAAPSAPTPLPVPTPPPTPPPTTPPSPPAPPPGAIHNGLNLPRTQYDTNQGNFRPGIFAYNYNATDIDKLKAAGFTSTRLGVNVDTALGGSAGAAVLGQMRSYVEQLGGTSIICMWDTLLPGQSGHGDGRVNNTTEAALAWRAIAAAFAGLPHVKFEIFNEPFGYSSVAEYYAEMQQIIAGAGLPRNRVILDGNGYAVDVRGLSDAGWEGEMAYHFYPNWVPSGQQSDSGYAARVNFDLNGLSNRVYVTEFGSDLSRPNYDKEDPNFSDGGAVNSLRGLEIGLHALKLSGEGVRGVYHWHGWDNGDSYSFFGATNSHGSAKVRSILQNS